MEGGRRYYGRLKRRNDARPPRRPEPFSRELMAAIQARSARSCKWNTPRRDPTENLASPERITGSEAHDAESDAVQMDPALWGGLPTCVEEMVAAKLPLHAFYKARCVCKMWHSLASDLPLLEQHSNSSLPTPHFILHGDRGCHQTMLVRDENNNRHVLKPLPPFAFQQAHTSVAHGVVYTGTCEAGSDIQGSVFNLHTKAFRRLPPLPPPSVASRCVLSKLVVDKHSGSYKVLVAWNDSPSSVYDSMTCEWTRRAPSPLVFQFDESAQCGDVLFFKRCDWSALTPILRPQMFSYSFKNDLWTTIPLAFPYWCSTIRGLGEWRGALRDMTMDGDLVFRVWEFELSGHVWREVDRMPNNIWDWLFDRYVHRSAKTQTTYCGNLVLLSNEGFPSEPGLVRFVLYDMARKSWEQLNVTKNWICFHELSTK